MAESGFRHIPPEQPSTHGGDTVPGQVRAAVGPVTVEGAR